MSSTQPTQIEGDAILCTDVLTDVTTVYIYIYLPISGRSRGAVYVVVFM